MNVLLHMCCGPCSIYPVRHILAEGYRLMGYFFNPNIHPYTEFKRRIDTLREYAESHHIDTVIDDRYLLEEFLYKVMRSNGPRCSVCYEFRLREVARYARENNYDCFSTTLLVSPYQNHELIKDIGYQIANQENVKFLYRDFRPGWKEGVQISRELNMYRQPYCGCIFSEKERYLKKGKKGD